MKRLLLFLRPLRHSHPLGLLIAFSAFMAMTDVAAVESIIPGQLGFRQAQLLAATPILCVLVCLIVFLMSPVGNCSQYKPIRRIGRIPILGRYCVFAGIVCGAVLLGLLSLNLLASRSIQSLKLSGDISPLSVIPYQIQQDVGEGVTFRWRGGETRVFFLKEKRAAVEHALQKEHIAAEE
jgi:hypothetical protein